MRYKLTDYQKEQLRFAGRAVELIVLTGVILVSIAAVHAYYCVPDFGNVSYWRYLWNFILDNAPLIGTLTGFLGIFFGFLFLGAQFKISQELVLTNTNRIQVAVQNRFFCTDITDITIEMDFLREERNGKDVITQKIDMSKESVTILRGRLYGSAKCNYIFHSKNGFVWNDQYTRVRCRVSAQNGISGIKRVKEEIFTREQLKRGKFVDGVFVPQNLVYPTKTSKEWDPEIGRMCNTLQRISEAIVLAIEPASMSNSKEMLDRIGNAKEQVARLRSKHMRETFASLRNNADTIKTITDDLELLHIFYQNTKNLNPSNKEKRKELLDRICKYVVFIGDQMNRDINDKYKSLNS